MIWHISPETITIVLSTLPRTIESEYPSLFESEKGRNHFPIAFPRRRILSCGILETPRFGRKSNFQFTPGAVVTFECNEGFFLNGDRRRMCGEDGRWDIPQYGYTECLREFILFLFFMSLLFQIATETDRNLSPSKNEHLLKDLYDLTSRNTFWQKNQN